MAVFRTSPLYPILEHRKPQDITIPPTGADPMSLSVHQNAATHETTLLQPMLQAQDGRLRAQRLFKYLPNTTSIDIKLLILEARLDTIYKECEAAVDLQGQLLSWLITYALSIDPKTPPGTLQEHIVCAHRFQVQWLHVIAQMVLTYNALFFAVREPLTSGIPADIRSSIRCQELLRRVKQAEEYLLAYDIYCNYPMGELLGILASTLPNKSLNPRDRSRSYRKSKLHQNSEFRRLLYGLIRRRRVVLDGGVLSPTSLASYLNPRSIHWELARMLHDGWLTRGNKYREYIYIHNHNALDGLSATDSENSDDEYEADILENVDSREGPEMEDGDSDEEFENLDYQQDQETEPFAPSQGWPYIPPLHYSDDEDPGVID